MPPSTRNSNVEPRPNMVRNASIDSESSSTGPANIVGVTRTPSTLIHHRASAEVAGPEDVAAYIAAAGSPEAAVLKALNEKNSAAAHSAQLWRLVEKQRAMIIDLNRNLEKSMKEKDRYRRRTKDQLISSGSAPSASGGRLSDAFATDREHSQSPAMGESARASHPVIHDTGNGSRKASESSDAASSGPRRSDTPQDAAIIPSSTALASPQPDHTSSRTASDANGLTALPVRLPSTRSANQIINTSTTPPLSPRADDDTSKTPQQIHSSAPTPPANAVSPPASATLAGYKNATRKAPPAPLEFSPRAIQPLISRALANESDSEYEDEESEDAREQRITRGRRKTREEDDREREALLRQEVESHSQAMKEKSSKSKSKSESRTNHNAQPDNSTVLRSTDAGEAANAAQDHESSQQSSQARQRAVSDGQGLLPRNATAPSLLSPGLPMSPRPGDRPINSPLPRPPNKAVNSIPMSPKAGLPLSPRPPKHALPIPPQTPLAFTSPHLARAEQYNQNSHMPSQVTRRPSSEVASLTGGGGGGGNVKVSTAVDGKVSSDVYRGLVTEQYPDLLLPPNALPSISVQVGSAVMRRSRLGTVAISQQLADEPVLVIGVHQRTDNRQLWRIEKTVGSLAILDMQLKGFGHINVKFPDKSLFLGAAPARVDARRVTLDIYFEQMLEAIQDERTAKVFCRFLSSDTAAAEVPETPTYGEPSPVSPGSRAVLRREGYLTKKGKNFGGWKARYFVLDGQSLKYFEGPGGAQLGTIKLQNAQIGKQAPNASAKEGSEDDANEFRHAFLILEPKRKDSSSLVRHVLCAESDDERDAWVESLLLHVDWRDATDGAGAGPATANGSRSARLQKNSIDVRPGSHLDGQQYQSDSLRYDQMIAGDAPVMGSSGARGSTPPPRYDENVHGFNISGPSNAQLIQNNTDWGMRTPATPSATSKDKKRGLFSFRGRSSSEIAPQDKSGTPGHAPDGHGSFARAAFGVPLAEAVAYAQPAGIHTDLPAVVYRCIEYLEHKKASSEEGIFRLSGSNTIIKALRERFNTEGDVDLVADGEHYDIHAVASLLKLFLRELPASILTRELHLDFLKCLELQEQDKIASLNVMVNRLPHPNRALLETLSAFLLSIVNNAETNKMNVRNVGIVFAPTLNVPGPLISAFVEDQKSIFGSPVSEAESPIAREEVQLPALPTDLRSPRRQMFSDIPTPAYNQTQFSPLTAMPGNPYPTNDTGMIPVHPTYQMAPQGDGAFGSLNDALRSPTMQSFGAGTNSSTPSREATREAKNKRRESSMLIMSQGSQSSSNSGSGSGSIAKQGSGLSGVGEDRYGRF